MNSKIHLPPTPALAVMHSACNRDAPVAVRRVDISVIALWLVHENPKTTYMYVEADLAMKERALARLQEPGMTALRCRAPDSLLQFLKSL